MPLKRFFAFSPDEILDLEEAVNRVLPVVLELGKTMEAGTRIQVDAMTKFKVSFSPAEQRAIQKKYGDSLRPFWGKYKFCSELTVYVGKLGQPFSRSLDGKIHYELIYHFPGIEGLPSHFVASFIGKRIRQLLIATQHPTLAVDEFNNEYFYVYRQDDPDSVNPLKR